jgi:hypothetical protein
MKFQEILSFLQNEEKRKDFICKLTQEGENSEQIQALEKIIISLNLNKPHKCAHEKTILQNTFHYCCPTECFLKFRLVSKSWQNAIETIHFHRTVQINGIENHIERSSGEKFYFSKYLKTFKGVQINLTPEILLKWDSISQFILTTMKKLSHIKFVCNENLPINFQNFLFKLFQNSQTSLKSLEFFGKEILNLPKISLPNVNKIEFHVTWNHGNQSEKFHIFMKTLLQNCKEDLKRFYVYDVWKTQNIISYFANHYPKNCLTSKENILASQNLPIIITHLPFLGKIQQFQFTNQIEYLEIEVQNFNKPNLNFEQWENYKILFALCSQLKTIRIFLQKENRANMLKFNDKNLMISPFKREIWKNRFEYLKNQGIEVIIGRAGRISKTYEKHLLKKLKWGFIFKDSSNTS